MYVHNCIYIVHYSLCILPEAFNNSTAISFYNLYRSLTLIGRGLFNIMALANYAYRKISYIVKHWDVHTLMVKTPQETLSFWIN